MGQSRLARIGSCGVDEAQVRAIVRDEFARLTARPDTPLTFKQVGKLHHEMRAAGGSKADLREIVVRVAGVERETEASQRFMDDLLDAIAAFTPPPVAS